MLRTRFLVALDSMKPSILYPDEYLAAVIAHPIAFLRLKNDQDHAPRAFLVEGLRPLVFVLQLARQRMLRQMPESSRGFLGDVDPGEEVGADGDRPMSRACIDGHSRSMVGRVLQASGVVLGNRLSEFGILTRLALIRARAT